MLKNLDLIHMDLSGKIKTMTSGADSIMVDKFDLYIYLAVIQGVMVGLGDKRAFKSPGTGSNSEVYPSKGQRPIDENRAIPAL